MMDDNDFAEDGTAYYGMLQVRPPNQQMERKV
jgi:hypothetical protein